jgi:uncharacterized membrane protein
MKHAAIAESTFMDDASLRSMTKSRALPLHSLLVSFSAAYLSAALVTDLVYWQIPDVLWERFSIWLITAGLVMAGLATIAYLIDLTRGGLIDRPALPQVAGYALAIVVSLINAFIHSRDGYTAVVPTGLMLSALVVVILLLTAWASVALAVDRVGGKI